MWREKEKRIIIISFFDYIKTWPCLMLFLLTVEIDIFNNWAN